MLESDTVVVRKPTPKTTHLTVVNDETYQTLRHKDETEVKRKRHGCDDSADPAGANPCLCNTNDKDARECKNRTKDIHWALLDLNGKPQVTNSKEVSNNPQNAMVHNQVHDSHFPKELQKIINRWDELPEHVRQTIKMLVESAK